MKILAVTWDQNSYLYKFGGEAMRWVFACHSVVLKYIEVRSKVRLLVSMHFVKLCHQNISSRLFGYRPLGL